MGLWGRKEPDRSEWLLICQSISQGLAGARAMWFEACVGAMRDRSPIRVVNDHLSGAGELALRSHQLLLSFEKIATHKYIAPRNGKDFADLLFASVCGQELAECTALFLRYEESEKGQRLFRFTSDIVRHITGVEHPPVQESMFLVSMYAPLLVTTGYVVADSFGDRGEAKRLMDVMTSNH